MCLLYFVFLMVSGFTILNMLIGVVVEVVTAVGKQEAYQMQALNMRADIEKVLEDVDPDNAKESTKVTLEVFEKMLLDERMQAALRSNAVTHKEYRVLSNCLFADDSIAEMENQEAANKENKKGQRQFDDFTEFIQELANMTPEREATVMDVADMRKILRGSLRSSAKSFDDSVRSVRTSQKKVTKRMDKYLVSVDPNYVPITGPSQHRGTHATTRATGASEPGNPNAPE
jgi:hypothetical protein